MRSSLPIAPLARKQPLTPHAVARRFLASTLPGWSDCGTMRAHDLASNLLRVASGEQTPEWLAALVPPYVAEGVDVAEKIREWIDRERAQASTAITAADIHRAYAEGL